MTSRTWFITGATRGLGAIWTEAILKHGDRVAATARDVAALQPLAGRYGDRLLPLALDVTDQAAVDAAVHTAEQRFGRIDILVNNAGHMLTGAVEEVTAEQARAQMDVNYFGALWTTRAVLPGMRERRAGRILQVSSIGGLVAYPALGLYQASKWALEAMSQSLAAEVAAYGVHVTLIKPIMFPTELATASPQVTPDPAYAHAREALYAGAAASGFVPGDPSATAQALLALADTPNPPLRVLFGTNGLDALRTEYAARLAGLATSPGTARAVRSKPYSSAPSRRSWCAPRPTRTAGPSRSSTTSGPSCRTTGRSSTSTSRPDLSTATTGRTPSRSRPTSATGGAKA
ncbi:SDR family NAD(P)-dependent oxidoreductase [Paractinoplanes lichenicola]|uniref:SDR family NAD(P)-dependent oxidoreductase n=1 Tax=Paractinoplanes lichenicola TaxID=2802976 RepID=A0ABS1VMY1_9ACTN|nr:SDR family NAD(P)-dependent oxidoreductase [Actinoplanes lichenicola]MBL7256009.1 SDR family NAD(P)-dependent oxidoreductase [Actinoplanes lichenicola]